MSPYANNLRPSLPVAPPVTRYPTRRPGGLRRRLKEGAATLLTGAVLTGALMAATGNDAAAAGLLRPTNGGLPPLDLERHTVDVVIEDGYAVTTVEQVFGNPNSRDLEAVYSFPVPHKAAVSDFTFWIDGKPVTGEVVEKQQARSIYESEKQAGHDAGLTEQDGHKSFDIAVSPVRAGGKARIRMTYIQPAHVDTGIGRYVYPLEEGGVDEEKLAFWTTDSTVKDYFRFSLWLRPAVPVDALRLPAHPGAQVSRLDDGSYKVVIEQGGSAGALPAASAVAAADREGPSVPAAVEPAVLRTTAQFGSLPPQEGGTGGTVAAGGTGGPGAFRLDGDVVVYWKLADGLPGSVDLVAHRRPGTDAGTFMLTVTPGDELPATSVDGVDWLFVLDTSGSMDGKIASLREGVRRALDKMRPKDRVHLVTFDDAARSLTPGPVPVTAENRAGLLALVNGLTPGGGTNLYGGLEAALQRADADRVSAIVLVTDGVANVGETEQRAFHKLVKSRDVRLFTFVMGNGANRPLLDGMTRVSGGTALSVSNNDDIVGQMLSATSKVTHESLHDIRVSIDGVPVEDLTPQDPGSLYRGEQLVLFGRYRGHGSAKVRIEGRIAGADRSYETTVELPETAIANPEIERLWSFSKVEGLMQEVADFGETDDRRQAVVDVAVQGGLVTPYTSMLVLREDRFATHGIGRTNAARVAEEQVAQQQRAAQPVVPHRVDTAQPAFSAPQPRYSGGGGGGGGGNVGLLGLLAAAVLGWFGLRRPQGAGR